MYTLSFNQINKCNIAEAGGKGASLGEMINAGITVPPGFVVLAQTFEQFLEKNKLNEKIDSILKQTDPKKPTSLDASSKKIQTMVINSKVQKEIEKEILNQFSELNATLVAVRSSATSEDSSNASWAGELESYLNVTKKELLDSVKKCWSSLFTSRAIFYRFEKNLHNDSISVAVVIQKMIQSEVSGICFTAHPVTKERNKMVIEAGYGLGEAIVGGKITPDTYIISKVNGQILDKHISEQKTTLVLSGEGGVQEKNVPDQQQKKQKLTDRQIHSLSELCKSIEEHYLSPQDIEWAFEKESFYIVQSRPITTL